jgi:hypothetical protein
VDTGTAEYPQPAVSAAAARIDVPVSANAGRVATAYAPAGQAAAETRHLAAAFDAKPADRPREEFLAAAGSSAADAAPVDPFAIGTRGATDGGAGAGDPGSDRHTHRQAPADPATAAYAGPIRQVATADSGAGLLDRASGQPAAPDLIAEPTSDGQPLSHAIVRSLKVQWRQGVGEATLRLRPEFLGELTVSLRVQGGGVTAVLQSDSPLVRGWIEAHQADLKKALEGQGLSLENLVIDPEGHPQQRREENPQDESQARHQRRGPKDTRRFEALL